MKHAKNTLNLQSKATVWTPSSEGSTQQDRSARIAPSKAVLAEAEEKERESVEKQKKREEEERGRNSFRLVLSCRKCTSESVFDLVSISR